MDLKAAFSRANSITPTKSATSLEVGKYHVIERMERRTTRYGDQVLVTFISGQKVWLPNSFSRELRDEVISTVVPGEWELCYQGMKLIGSRYTKARFDVRAVVPPQQKAWHEESPNLFGTQDHSPAIL